MAFESAVAPLLPPWEEVQDRNGNPYFYNTVTRVSSRKHPLDSKFSKLVHALRRENLGVQESGSGAWMQFLRARDGGKEEAFWHDFRTGQEAVAPPSKAWRIPEVPRGRIPQYDHHQLNRRPVQNKLERITKLRVLTFKSWWFEDTEEPSLGCGTSVGGGLKKRYVTLTFDLHSNMFCIALEDGSGSGSGSAAVKFSIPACTSTGQEGGLECWDHHVGARVQLLGKPTTLMQSNGATTEWLEHHASQLRKLKNGLEKQLEKYKMKSVVQALTFEKGPRENCGTLNGSKIAPGGASLRQLIIQTEGLVQLLHEYRPKIALQYATQLAEYVGQSF